MRISPRMIVAAVVMMAAIVFVPARWTTSAQEAFPRGQNIAPVYEGWNRNPDGSYNLVFGYFNRNWEEEIDLPIGPANTIEPGGDLGQPTHFYPRRNRFLFSIRVPADFGNKELVWTLTSNGKTERAYATLKPDYFIDDVVIMNNNGAGGSGGGGNNINGNKPPVLKLGTAKTQSVGVGQPLVLTATVTDDGIPKRRVVGRFNPPSASTTATSPASPPAAPAGATGQAGAAGAAGGSVQRIGTRCCPDSSSGLRLAWFVYRGKGDKVTFDPQQYEVWEDYRDGRNSPWSNGWEPPMPPADGKWTIRATFSEPGTYVLRAQAHDGGLAASEDITVTVK